TATACTAPAPPSKPTAAPATRPPAVLTPTPDPGASALKIIPLSLEESQLPPPEPTPEGFASGRPAPTPAATPEAAWKYLTITFAIENSSDTARLVGIGGTDPSATNLAAAVLTARDGKRYKALRSNTSFGLRTATARSLTTYPVLLRLPAGFRAAAESSGTLSILTPARNVLTFKIPADLTDYGTLSIPPLTSLGPKTGDEDGVVYPGDAPTVGDFGRSLTPPDPAAILIWDGRSAGADRIAAGQSQEPRRLLFVVPRELRNGILVLAGDVEVMYTVAAIPVPPPTP